MGIVLSVIGVVFMRPVSILLGATDAMIEDCVLYGRIVISFTAAYMLQNVFQSFLVAAEKPNHNVATIEKCFFKTLVLMTKSTGWSRLPFPSCFQREILISLYSCQVKI